REAGELQWDLNYLLKLWNAIDGAAKNGKGAFLIYQESSLVIRAIRDYFNADIGEILIDTDDIFEQAHQFMAHVMPEQEHRVKRYRDDAPLFSRFQIEHQIESAYARTVQLPSGGAIVIDHTEALVSVDVNSARAIKGGDIEETATRTNLEAADEVARQMRLRDLGGLIVIDFIDMEESKNRREVENRLRDALRQDRARVQFGTISKFGLMEMSRQRLKPALSEGASIPCPRCGGAGHIRDTESSALQILRIIQEESMKDNTAAVHAQVPVEVAAFLLNEKRPEIAKIELQQRISVLLVPNKSLETPHYKLERLKHDDPRLDRIEASYKMAEEVEDATTVTRRSQEPTNKQTPVIKGVLPDAPAPVAPVKPQAPAAAKPAKAAAPVKAAAASGGFFAWLKNLFGGSTEETKPAVDGKKDEKTREGRNGERNSDRREGGRDGRRGGRDGRRGERTERPEGEARAPREGGRRGEGRNEVRDGEGRPARGERSERPAGERQPREGRRDRGDNPRNDAPAELAADGSEVRTERAPRAERGERGEGRRERGEGRGERGEGRRERGERRNNDKAPGELNTAENAVSTEGQDHVATDNAAPAENNGERRERRSRDRYGRDRRERNGEPRQDNGNETALADNDNAAPVAEVSGEDRPAPRSYFERAQQAAADAAPQASAVVAEVAPASAVAPVPVAAPVVAPVAAPVTVTAPVPAPVAAPAAASSSSTAARGLPKVASYQLPLESLQQVAQTSGLVWVNSDAEKIAAVQAAIAAEPKPVHVPRERPPAVVLDEGPLVLVETRKDLKDMNLPF
ncbi:MAG: ribonuclease E/G, partial [Limnohabitans sp.]